MHAFCVVPVAPACSSSIKGVEIEQKLSAMVVCVLFLYGAVESFTMGILLRGARTSFVMREVEFRDHLSKMLLKLTPVVGEYVLEGKREDLSHDIEELLRSDGGMGRRAERVPKPGVQINERDDVSP